MFVHSTAERKALRFGTYDMQMYTGAYRHGAGHAPDELKGSRADNLHTQPLTD